jgi:hypothetical protein
MVTNCSFERHARRAGQTSEQIRGRRLDEGWATALRLDREAARAGLRIQIGGRPRHHIEELVSAGDRSTTVRSGLSKDLPNEPRTALAGERIGVQQFLEERQVQPGELQRQGGTGRAASGSSSFLAQAHGPAHRRSFPAYR